MKASARRHSACFVMNVCVVAAVLVCAAGPPPASAPSPGRASLGRLAWMRIDTPNFTLFGDVPEPRLRRIADRLETYRAALEALHPGSRTSPRETFMYVFADAERGWPFTPPASGGGHKLGVNPPYDVGNYVTVAAPLDDPPLEPLYHSYAHQFLDDNFPRLPLTVTEGLAEFYSGFAVEPQRTLIGLGNADHVKWLRANEALSLPVQFSVDPGAAMLGTANGRAAFVAGSWALMHYLVSGSGDKRARLPEFLKALQLGTPPGEAATATVGMSLEGLQQEVAQYVRAGRFLPLRVAEGPQQADPAPARALPRDEALAALGDLLGHARPDAVPDAEAYFAEALRLNPDQARAHAGLGYLRYAGGRFGEAVPELEAAIAAQPDAMSCYLLARSLQRLNATAPATGTGTPPWLARARSLLERAIALRPGFAAPYVVLGATHTLPDGDAATGIALLRKARLMLPARTDIAGSLVYLLLREGDFIGAQRLVDEALVHGGDEGALKAARAAIQTFDDHLAAKQSLRTVRPPDKKAAAEAFKEKFVVEEARRVREELARPQDPETRARLEKELRNLEDSLQAVDGNAAAEIFNEAVDRANNRDYDKAIELLSDLLPRVRDPELKARIETLLERLRADAARMKQPVR